MFTVEGRAHFERLLEKERAELDALAAEHRQLSDKISEKRAHIKWSEDLLGVPAHHGGSPRTRVERRPRRSSKPRKISRIEKTQRCLEEAGMSLYVGDILRTIGEENTEMKRNSLASQLMRYAKDGRIFVLDREKGSRHFGLIPGENTNSSEPANSDVDS